MVTALRASTSARAKATAPPRGRRRCPCARRGCVRRCGRNIRLQTPPAPARSGGRAPRASVATRVWESEWARSATGGRNRSRTRPVPARAAPPLGAVCAWCARLRASARRLGAGDRCAFPSAFLPHSPPPSFSFSSPLRRANGSRRVFVWPADICRRCAVGGVSAANDRA